MSLDFFPIILTGNLSTHDTDNFIKKHKIENNWMESSGADATDERELIYFFIIFYPYTPKYATQNTKHSDR